MTAIHLRIEPPGGQPADRECRTGTLTFGRGTDSDVVVADHSMSRHHARIATEDGHWVVEDLGSRNGTFLNMLQDNQGLSGLAGVPRLPGLPVR